MRGGRVRALALAALAGCASWWSTGRIVDGTCTHLGVRGHTDLTGVAVTLQLTHDWGYCAETWPQSLDGGSTDTISPYED